MTIVRQSVLFRHTSIKYTFLFLILILLVLCPKICINGATRGLLLWFNTVLPTLFPFFLVTRLILSLNMIPRSLSGFYPVMTGLIAGYPTGAATISELIKSGQIKLNQGQLLMIISNNASPGFLIGIAGCICSDVPSGQYYIWFSTIMSSAVITLLYCKKYLKKTTSMSDTENKVNDKIKTGNIEKNNKLSEYNVDIHENKKNNTAFLGTLEDTMFECFRLLVLIGGYIIIFSILADFSSLIVSGFLPHSIIAGIFEITTGVTLILSDTGELPVIVKGTAAAALCGFGGISALLQTSGVIRDSGMLLIKYAFHKILCGAAGGAIFYVLYSFR